MIDIIPIVLIEAHTKRLGTNADGSMPTLLEVLTSIRPSCAFIQLMVDVTEPRASHTMKRHTAERFADIAALRESLLTCTKTSVNELMPAAKARLMLTNKQKTV